MLKLFWFWLILFILIQEDAFYHVCVVYDFLKVRNEDNSKNYDDTHETTNTIQNIYESHWSSCYHLHLIIHLNVQTNISIVIRINSLKFLVNLIVNPCLYKGAWDIAWIHEIIRVLNIVLAKLHISILTCVVLGCVVVGCQHFLDRIIWEVIGIKVGILYNKVELQHRWHPSNFRLILTLLSIIVLLI